MRDDIYDEEVKERSAIFRKRLMQELILCNETNYKVAKTSGLSPTTITEYLIGKRIPNLKSVIRLSHYFNVTPDYLLGYSDESC